MVHRAASASRRRRGEPAASESAVARTSAATQPSAEGALARATVSREQSEGPVEERETTSTDERCANDISDDGAPRSECDPSLAWRAGGERELHCADECSDAAERRGGAGSSRGQRRAEQATDQRGHKHQRTRHGRHERCRVHRAASASRRRHGGLAASESAVARASVATQPSAEAAHARAAVSGEQSKGPIEESTGTDGRSTGIMSDAACIEQRARAAAGMASRRRSRAPSRGRAQRSSRAPRRRWLESQSAASRARDRSWRARAPTNAARAA